MSEISFLLDVTGWPWIVVITGVIVGGYFFLDKLMRKGVYEESTEGRSRVNRAFSELQSLVNPEHHHVAEARERKRAEHDNAGDGPEPST